MSHLDVEPLDMLRVTFVSHHRERIHSDDHKTPVTFDWPDELPLPAVGDEVLWKGATVTIVQRNGPTIDRIVAGEPIEEQDRHYTLTWLDRRAALRSNCLIPLDDEPWGS
jgi:hypothetical protein